LSPNQKLFKKSSNSQKELISEGNIMDEAVQTEESKAEASAPVEETTQPTAEAQATDGSIKLGGGIELNGFDVEKAHLVVIKKMVGNYTKEMSEKAQGFEKVVVSLNKEGDSYNIKAELTASGNQISSDSSEKNLFMALNKALQEVISKIATS
jgi:hypothetical protein